jgi:hypothetical protein
LTPRREIEYIEVNMKTISVAVSEEDYRAFQEAAAREHRSVAQLIREAMAEYRARRLPEMTPLRQLPVLAGHRLLAPLPPRSEIYDEIFEA